MLQVKGPLKPPNMEWAEHASGLAEGIKSFAIVRRQLPIFLVLIPLAAALGWLYLLNTPQSYTAVAKLVIDMRRVQDFQQQQKLGETIDVAAVATQAEVLMSESVSLAVIKDLKLNEDPEFINPSAGFIGSFFNPIFRMFDFRYRTIGNATPAPSPRLFRIPPKNHPSTTDICDGGFISIS